MKLEYTPRTIKEIEDVAKQPMVNAIQEYSMSNIILFVRKGLGVEEDDAYKKVEAYLKKEDNDLMSLYLEILEALQRGGYIPKSVNIQEMKDNMQDMSV